MKTLLKLTCCLLPFAGFAQKVDLDRYNIHCEFKDLPAKPLGDNYSTYAVEVGVPGNVLNAVSQANIENGVSIRGLKRVTNTPSLLVYFNSEDLVINEVSIKDYVDIQKDSKGNETSRKTYYYVQAIYSLKCEGKCYSAQKQLLYSASLGSSQNTYKSEYMGTYKIASDYWNNNRDALKNTFIAGIINPAITSMGNRLSTDYGYVAHSGYDNLWILNSKKHPEHEAQQAAIAKIKDEFGRMKADSSIEWLATDMEPIIQYFNEVESKYTKDEKGDKKMRYAAYYNKAVIYTYLCLPDKAVAEADKLVANGYDTRDGERLKKNAEDLRAMLDRNHRTTTHFVL